MNHAPTDALFYHQHMAIDMTAFGWASKRIAPLLAEIAEIRNAFPEAGGGAGFGAAGGAGRGNPVSSSHRPQECGAETRSEVL